VGENEQVRRFASRRLRRVGFTVCETDNGIDALVLAHGDPPDLIVVDHVVGWLDVRYLLTLLRRDTRTAGIPILLITPRAGGALARECSS
jgi:CheY-like chemotaxis protein